MTTGKKPVRVGVCDHDLADTIRSLSLGFPHEVVVYSGDLNKIDLIIAGENELAAVAAQIKPEQRPTLFATVEEGTALPQIFQDGRCDDLIVLPLRRYDLVRAIRLHFTFASIRELENTSAALPEVVRKFEEDIQLAQKIQRKLIRDRFPALGPVSIKSKYWCGLKSGGDYFDVIDFADGVHAGIFMTDASSYAVSTALLGSLVQLSLGGEGGNSINPADRLAILEKKLAGEMRDKDKLSIFYGILNRKTLRFDYVSAGGAALLLDHAGGKVETLLAGDNEALTKKNWKLAESKSLALQNGDRLVLLSDGWSEAIGKSGAKTVQSMLEDGIPDAQTLVNDLSFAMKKTLDDDSLPPEDCSVLIFEVAKNALRLAQ